MVKTTVHLPDQLKRDIARVARAEGCSEAEVIRAALVAAVAQRGRPRPSAPLWSEGFGAPDTSERVDDVLAEGFGRDAVS